MFVPLHIPETRSDHLSFLQTKKKRPTRRQPEAELIDASAPSTSNGATESMDVDVKPIIPDMDANFVDDDDLQAVLAQARRRNLKKPKIITAEEIAERREFIKSFLRQRSAN